ncbi:neogenin-like [Rhopilema esculentum]|uniref:neogenin-like n=1 Tax=Rhopilema esculentum TaxID=499914 RepID=UPI0031E19051|eukprot:gene2656-859_t
MNPNGFIKVLEMNLQTNDNWNEKKYSAEVDLLKGFRYEIVAYHYGTSSSTGFFRLGVTFPDATEVKPIPKAYLRRSMAHYKWTGLIAQRYDSLQMGPYPYTISYIYNNNLNYPNNPTSFTCKSTLFDPSHDHDFGDYYALRYIGYIKVPSNGAYKLKLECDDICEFFITKNNVESSLGTSVFVSLSNPGSVEMDAGQLSSSIFYPIKAFMAEAVAYDYIRVQHRVGSGNYSSSWANMLYNLKPDVTAMSIPAPVLAMINSTVISITLPSAPYLPPLDYWTYITNHEVCYYKVGNESNVHTITVTGSLPQTVIASVLGKYTDYQFFVHYFGEIGSADHNIISPGAIQKTDEDVPDVAPPNLAAVKQSSTSILVTWRTFSDLTLWNGIGVGFEIQYKIKTGTSSPWLSIIIGSVGDRGSTVTELKKYTIYEFKVAGRTSKGSGVFSAPVEERTMEDVPSAAPANVTARNTSSSSIQVSWNDVPSDHQNGIITGYKVYIKKAIGNNPWTSYEVTGKSFTKSGLDFWTFYDVKVSAKTSVGEGTISNVTKARTDEDTPTGGPASIHIAGSKGSAMLNWQVIPFEHRNGIIRSYVIHFKIVNKDTRWNETISTALNSTVNGLEKNEHYEFKIAGKTNKGIGTFGESLKFSTYETNQVDEEAPSAFITNIKFTNMALVKHLSKVVQVTSTEECFNVCKNCFEAGSGCRCASINIKRAAATSIWGCEINEESKEAFPCDFVATEGSQYYEVN